MQFLQNKKLARSDIIRSESYKLCAANCRFLFVHAVAGEDVIRIENGDHDKRGESRGETAVIKHEAAVHTCGGGAYDCVDQAGKQALFPTVSPRNGAETRGERNTVDVYLRRKHPRKRFTEEGIDDANEKR